MVTLPCKSVLRESPVVLVVDDEPMVAELFREFVAGAVDCRLRFASSLREALEALKAGPVDLLVTDVELPDGDGLTLLADLKTLHPHAASMVVTGGATADRAITALRAGAVDFVPKPFSADHLTDRVRRALAGHRERARRDRRIDRLKAAVKRLGDSRREVSQKVDLLCSDLVQAYGELSRQMETVRIQEGFRQFLRSAKDLEQLLCHSMDWLLRQVGYCNIGVWLATPESEMQLGAYMKYTVAAENDLMDAVSKNLLKLAVRRGFVRLRGAEGAPLLTPAEGKYLAAHDVVALNCSYLGESLGVMVLFRDAKTPFSDDDVAAIKTVCPLFALELTRAVRGGDEPDPAAADDSLHEEKSYDDKPRKKSAKPDPADWWKRGEAPPF